MTQRRRPSIEEAVARLEWVEPPRDLSARIMQAVEGAPHPTPRPRSASAAAVRGADAPWTPAIGPRRALTAIAAAEGASLAALAGIAALDGGAAALREVANLAHSLLALTGYAWMVAEAARVTVAHAPWLGAVLVVPVVAAAVLLGRTWIHADTLKEGVS
ncbi:MAG: hypothetical protein IMW98_09935 [Firmicutes bacterium]|nr:hypothetical protein [Bacillota bacterium]